MADEELQIDNFKLVNCISTGGVSQVWEVFDVETNERFALKMLLKEAFTKPQERNILKIEHRIGRQFDHPNIIRVYDFKKTKNHCYYTMDFFPGPNIKSLIRGSTAHAQTHLKRLIECITMALGQVHSKGWVHKDVKPENILMNRSGEIRLIDFSLASRAPGALGKFLFKKTKTIQGTRTYIAPEIIRKLHATSQSDLYSLGVTIFEILTGRPPFMGGTPNDLLMKHIREPVPRPSVFNPNVTPEADKMVLRLMAKKPENRPKTANDLLAEFRSIKLFHENPEEILRQQKVSEDEEEGDILEGISSRADAERTAKGGSVERNTDASAAVKPAPKPVEKKPAAPAVGQQQQRPPQQQPPQQRPPQQMPPGYPQPGYPPQGYPQGYPNPGYPGQMPPGYPQGQFPPGMQPPPGYPQMPPGQGGAPQQRPPQPQKPAQQPAGQVQKPPQKPPQQQPPKQEDTNDDDLPFADELPDIL